MNIRSEDVIDILLVSFLLFHVYNLMRGTVAVRVFFGFLILYLIYLVVKAAEMELLSAILGQFMGVGVLAAIILFQQEIRKFLLLIGKTTVLQRRNNFFSRFFSKDYDNRELGFQFTPIIEASQYLAGQNTGALIVFSRNSPLKFYAESGDILEATISKRLILSIFNKESPLHDGAVIIYNGKIKAARCILPVTENPAIPAHFGLRHRAAIGMSETTDSLILAVSEETGQLAVACNGKLFSHLSAPEVRSRLNQYFSESGTQKKPIQYDKVSIGGAPKMEQTKK